MSTGPDTLLRWSAPARPWTEPDLHLFPQDGHRYEIVDGSLHVTPPLDADHERVVSHLVSLLRAAAPDGWWACARLGVRIGDSHVVPDLAVLRPGAAGAPWNRPADVALVVEVESPATRRYDRLLKHDLYASAGIGAYWRVERPDGKPPVAQMHTLVDGAYGRAASVCAGERTEVSVPYPVTVAPGTWG